MYHSLLLLSGGGEHGAAHMQSESRQGHLHNIAQLCEGRGPNVVSPSAQHIGPDSILVLGSLDPAPSVDEETMEAASS